MLKPNTLLATLTAAFLVQSVVPIDAQSPYPPPFPYRNFDPGAAVRLDVTPKETEVYVDGYFAGIADDFDGVFQRLRLTAGGHEITLYRDGFRSFTQRVYLMPDNTFRLKHRMEPLAPGEIAEARPIPSAAPPAEGPVVQLPPRGQAPRGPVAPRGRSGRPLPPQPAPPEPDASPADAVGPGTLALHVEPADATLRIDGEPWSGPADADRAIELSDGQHTIQVSKRGYVSYLTDVRVRRGETVKLDVSLRMNP